jgi:hypothetical protein
MLKEVFVGYVDILIYSESKILQLLKYLLVRIQTYYRSKDYNI